MIAKKSNMPKKITKSLYLGKSKLDNFLKMASNININPNK